MSEVSVASSAVRSAESGVSGDELSRAAEKCASFGSRKVHHVGRVRLLRGEVVAAGQAESRSDGA